MGSEHFLHLIIKKRTKFLCSFNEIADYPFETEECLFQVTSTGTDEQFTDFIIDSFKAPIEASVGEYSIDKWSFEKDESNNILLIKMVLTRNFFGIFMVTYLPTILMNIINQASNHINGDSKYDMIITVNITSMMVLASIYVSVSSSLPSTPTIKPVELWLLFNLSYPFLVIITNIVIQVYCKKIHLKQPVCFQKTKLSNTESSIRKVGTFAGKENEKSKISYHTKDFEIVAVYVNPLLYITVSIVYFLYYFSI